MVILAALAVGKEALRDYSHPCSPKIYTQPQLFACLVLMVFLRTDYRGVEAHLRDLAAYRDWLGLTRVPDHSTLHKFAQRLLGVAVTDRLLAASVQRLMGRRRRIRRAAADSTGLEAGHRSPYFVQRRAAGQTQAHRLIYRRFPKLTLLTDCASHQVLALLTGRGPRSDVDELGPLLARLSPRVRILKLLADAGFDSEANHHLVRARHGRASLIPAKSGRPAKGNRPPTGRWRRRMRAALRTKPQRRRCGYTQRWQSETANSMIKRNLTDELTAIGDHRQNRQMRLLVLTHNIMILLWNWRFSTEQLSAGSGPPGEAALHSSSHIWQHEPQFSGSIDLPNSNH